jgi:thiol-disulfide isomerase/thioredoxin
MQPGTCGKETTCCPISSFLGGIMSHLTSRVGLTGVVLVFLWLGGCKDRTSLGPSPDTANSSGQPSNDVTATQPAKEQAAAPGILGHETGGIGIALGKDEENLVIMSILPDSEAALNKAIHVADRVIAVAEANKPAVNLQGKTVAEAVRLIRGPKGTTVLLTLVPAGKDEKQARVVTLVRGKLELSKKGVPFTELPGWGDGVPLSAGSEAPNIQMTAVPGKKAELLADFTGKVVVLEFWATWCAPCQTMVADLQTLREKNPKWKGKVVLIAASVDEDQDKLIKHLKAKGWNKTHNVQVGSDAKIAYHVGGVPTQYIIDQQGKIVATDRVGDIQKIVNELMRGE